MEDNNNVNENIGENEGTPAAPPPPPQQDMAPPPPQQDYTPPPPSPDPAGGGSLTSPNKDERNWAMFAHLAAMVTGILGAATSLPIFGFVGPLIIYLMKKDESPFVADQAREALNFHITLAIPLFVLWLLSLTVILLLLTIPLSFVIGVGALVFMIIAAVKSSAGELYRYPFILRLVQ